MTLNGNGYKTELLTVIDSNMDESHTHNTEQTKPNTKAYRPGLHLYEVEGQTKLVYGHRVTFGGVLTSWGY